MSKDDLKALLPSWEEYQKLMSAGYAMKARAEKAEANIEHWRHEVGKLHSKVDKLTQEYNSVSAELCKANNKQVRVKPLVWYLGDEPNEWKSGPYDVWCEFGKYQLYYWSIVMGEPKESAEDAKILAQADHEFRILANIEIRSIVEAE